MFTGYASLAGMTHGAFTGRQRRPVEHRPCDASTRDGQSHDTVLHDVALTLPQRSLLKEYEAMPWRHFRQAYLSVMSPTAAINYRNNDTIVRNVTRHVSIKDHGYRSGGARLSMQGLSNVNPLTDVKYDAPLLYTYNSAATDYGSLLVTLVPYHRRL